MIRRLLAALALPLALLSFSLSASAQAAAPTQLLEDLKIYDDSDLSSLTNVKGTLYFVANIGSGRSALMKTDGIQLASVRTFDGQVRSLIEPV